jgi:hypothetical protein
VTCALAWPQIGASPELLAEELERAQKTEQLKKVSAEDKAASDRVVWSKWLVTYRSRVRALAPAPPPPTAAAAEWAVWRSAVQALDAQRLAVMTRANPKFILRNYLAQVCCSLSLCTLFVWCSLFSYTVCFWWCVACD